MTCHVRVADDGRLVPPEELARELDLKPGDALVIDREDGKLVLKTRVQAVREIQARVRAISPGDAGDLVDELIAERRREGARDDAERGAWLRSQAAG